VTLLEDRIDGLLRSGVTCSELKSGYGGDAQTELRFVQLLADFARTARIRTRITLALGHVFQGEGDPDEFLEHLEKVVVPATYENGNADAFEVFCDDEGAMDLDMCSTILELYYRKKTPTRVACDRFEDSAGATLPVSFYARCALYLNKSDSLDLENLSNTGTVAVIVPGALDTDGDQLFPDVSKIRKASGRIAIAPDTSASGSHETMLQALSSGFRKLGLSAAETIAAATTNAAHALGVENEAGVIAAGRPADLAFFSAASLDNLFKNENSKCVATMCSGNLMQYSWR
jgi:imidazolonepropionase